MGPAGRCNSPARPNELIDVDDDDLDFEASAAAVDDQAAIEELEAADASAPAAATAATSTYAYLSTSQAPRWHPPELESGSRPPTRSERELAIESASARPPAAPAAARQAPRRRRGADEERASIAGGEPTAGSSGAAADDAGAASSSGARRPPRPPAVAGGGRRATLRKRPAPSAATGYGDDRDWRSGSASKPAPKRGKRGAGRGKAGGRGKAAAAAVGPSRGSIRSRVPPIVFWDEEDDLRPRPPLSADECWDERRCGPLPGAAGRCVGCRAWRGADAALEVVDHVFYGGLAHCGPCARHVAAIDPREHVDRGPNTRRKTGDHMFCSLAGCSNGNDSLACDNGRCRRIFCRPCVEAAFGRGAFEAAQATNPWDCFKCRGLLKDQDPRRAGEAWERVIAPFREQHLRNLQPLADRTNRRIAEHNALVCGADFAQRVDLPRSLLDEGITVLSLCDGIGGGYLALERAGIKVKAYVAVEIDMDAAEVLRHHVAKSGASVLLDVQARDLRTMDRRAIEEFVEGVHRQHGGPHLLLGGWPCNDLAGLNPYGEALKGDLSGLYTKVEMFQRAVRRFTPGYAFIFENLGRMRWTDGEPSELLLDRAFEVLNVLLNAILFTATERLRRFWTNLPLRPIVLGALARLLQDYMTAPNRLTLISHVSTITTQVPREASGDDELTPPFDQGACVRRRQVMAHIMLGLADALGAAAAPAPVLPDPAPAAPAPALPRAAPAAPSLPPAALAPALPPATPVAHVHAARRVPAARARSPRPQTPASAPPALPSFAGHPPLSSPAGAPAASAVLHPAARGPSAFAPVRPVPSNAPAAGGGRGGPATGGQVAPNSKKKRIDLDEEEET